MNTSAPKHEIKQAYLKFRDDRQMSLQNWGDVEERALALASSVDERVLRAAATMASTYNRSIQPVQVGDNNG